MEDSLTFMQASRLFLMLDTAPAHKGRAQLAPPYAFTGDPTMFFSAKAADYHSQFSLINVILQSSVKAAAGLSGAAP
jgi:hypothetical protein